MQKLKLFCTYTLLIFTLFSCTSNDIIGKWVDTNNIYWVFEKDGNFTYQGQYQQKPISGKYTLINKDSLQVEFEEKKEIIKITELNSEHLILGTSRLIGYNFYKNKNENEKDNEIAFQKNYHGKFFLEGNELEADVNNTHIKCDSVFAYFDACGITLDGYDRNKKIDLFICISYQPQLQNEPTLNQQMNSQDFHFNSLVSQTSQAEVIINNKEFDTESSLTGTSDGGRGSGSLQINNYKPNIFTYPEIKGTFSFEATSDLQKTATISVKNGTFSINRIMTNETPANVLALYKQLGYQKFHS